MRGRSAVISTAVLVSVVLGTAQFGSAARANDDEVLAQSVSTDDVAQPHVGLLGRDKIHPGDLVARPWEKTGAPLAAAPAALRAHLAATSDGSALVADALDAQAERSDGGSDATDASAQFALLAATGAAPNDRFEDARRIRLGRSFRVDTTTASVQPGERRPCGAIRSTVWFRFVAPRTGPLTAHTFGSDFDTVVSVYTGSQLDELRLVSCNDDTGFRLLSRASFDAVAGRTYWFQVGGHGSSWLGHDGTLGFSITRDRTGRIAGTVRAPSGRGLQRVCVTVRLQGELDDKPWGTMGIWTTTTGVGGRYVLGGLGTNRYSVTFAPCSRNSRFVQENYDNAGMSTGFARVRAVHGLTTGGIDAVLARGGSIRGVVTASHNGAPLRRVCVVAFRTDYQDFAFAVTRADGSYSTGGLPDGDYDVYFFECDLVTPRYLYAQYDAGGDAPVTVRVRAPRDTVGIDEELTLGGVIRGTVTDAATAAGARRVCAAAVPHDPTGLEEPVYWFDISDADGSYVVRGLPTDDYVVLFVDCAFETRYLYEWYDDTQEPGLARPLHVTEGERTGPINAALERGGVITGRVTSEATGQPMRGVCAVASAPPHFGLAVTGRRGRYRIEGLPHPGTYDVSFYDCDSVYYYESFDDGEDGSSTLVVVASPPLETSGVDAALAAPGRVVGTVTTPSGAPAQGVCVEVVPRHVFIYRNTHVRPDGTFVVPWAQADADNRVTYSDCEAWPRRLRTEHFDDHRNPDRADPVRPPHGGTARADAVLRFANRPPTAVNDLVTTRRGRSVVVAPLANDRDADRDALRFQTVPVPTHGTLRCSDRAVCTYTPDPGFVGRDRFGYVVLDGEPSGDAGIVAVTVRP